MKKLFPDARVMRGTKFDVHQDWEVPIPGFFIIASTRPKVRSVADFNDAEAKEFISIVVKLRRAMKSVLGITTVYLFQNEDSKHGFHLWVFPRHSWMKPFGKKIESVRPIMQYAQQHMTNKKALAEVVEQTKKMRAYFRKK